MLQQSETDLSSWNNYPLCTVDDIWPSRTKACQQP